MPHTLSPFCNWLIWQGVAKKWSTYPPIHMLPLQPPKPTEYSMWLFQMSRRVIIIFPIQALVESHHRSISCIPYMLCDNFHSTQKHLFICFSSLKHVFQSVHIMSNSWKNYHSYLYSWLNFSAEHFKRQLLRQTIAFSIHIPKIPAWLASVRFQSVPFIKFSEYS